MSIEFIIRLLIGVVLVAANGFFVATEFALTRIRQFPESDFQDSAGLRQAWKMTEKLEVYLTGCQVGITFTSILLGIIVEPAVTESIEPLLTLFGVGEQAAHGVGLIVGLVLLNLIHTIWAEQTPTYLGIERSKLVARYCAIPHLWWTRFAYPLLFLGDKVAKLSLAIFGVKMSRSWTQATELNSKAESNAPLSRAQMITQMGKLLSRSDASKDHSREVINAVKMDTIAAREIMIARDNINVLRRGDSYEQVIETVAAARNTRYPLVGDSLEDFRGIIYTPKLIAHISELRDGSMSLSEMASTPLTADEEISLSDLIDLFQEKRHELALVKNGERVTGLVTLTDALEIIVGQIDDPLDIPSIETETVS
ncbi:MAG: CNNM domain-containing protein [bacterium]|nr:CNNM domain-containing protein [bacterium]